MPRNRLSPEIYRYSGNVWMVTIVTNYRRPHLADPAIARSVVDSLTFKCNQTESDLLLWCVMPDHVHALITIGEGDLVEMLAEVKSFTGRAFKRQTGESLWQPGFHDHGVRTEEPLHSLAKYVVENPVRAGLVNEWSEWPRTGGILIETGEITDKARE